MGIAIFLCLSLVLLDITFPLQIPDPQTSFSQTVKASDGRTLRAFADENGIWRQQVDLKDVSEDYLQALIAYEDRWFWYHPGVNPVSMLRAFYLNWSCDCIVSGGSTLTMQVARILYPHTKSIKGKLYQILRAVQLEIHLDKREILNLYLNHAPFGGTIEGIEAASQAYLEKSASHMTRSEAALMAVLPQSPSRLRPDRHVQQARIARDKVLDRLLSLGYWTKAEIEQAKLEQVYGKKPARPTMAPLLARQLAGRYPQNKSIVTTIDYNLQSGVEDLLKSWVQSQPEKSSAAVLVVDNQSMKVKAYLGSADFSDKARFGHVDMVQAIRSPGSTLKPFIYGMAIDKGLVHSHSLLSDSPRHYAEYKPGNFSESFSGPVSLAEALQQSLNVPAVQVLNHLGPKYFDAKMQAAGVKLKLPENSEPSLAIALGGTGISLWQLVTAYASLANQGQVKAPVVLQDNRANESRYLLSKESAWIIYKILAEHVRPGEIRNENIASNESDISWKTGTSYGFRDAWAIGVSQRYSIGVWLGRPDGTPLPGHFGALNAAPLMFSLADRIHGYESASVKKPDAVKNTEICWPLGLLASATEKELCHQKHTAWIANNNAPATFIEAKEGHWIQNPMTIWINPKTEMLIDMYCGIENPERQQIALWPKELEPWIAHKYSRSGQIPDYDKSCEVPPSVNVGEVKIVGLEQGNVYRAQGESHELPVVMMQAIGGQGKRDWFVNGRYQLSTQPEQGLPYQFAHEGKYQIIVIDSQGDSDKVDVFVERGSLNY